MASPFGILTNMSPAMCSIPATINLPRIYTEKYESKLI